MKKNLLMNFSIDHTKLKINIEREFSAVLEKVWASRTESDIIDKRRAPRPFQTKTKVMDFKEGGYWLYVMVGPNKEEYWSKTDFTSIVPLKSYAGKDSFCDNKGNIDQSLPRSIWHINFNQNGDSTIVSIEITYNNLSDLEKTIEMGFKEGITSAFKNLDEIIM